MLQGTWFWKEAGCRKDFSTLVGQMKANAKLVTKRKVQKSTDSTIVHVVNEVRRQNPRGPQEVGTQSENVEDGMALAKRY